MTTKKPTYWELLKHPKWQEKRLRIMERAKFECEGCCDSESTLNVHHSYYERGLNPWEYPDDSLHCLCDACHERYDALRVSINRQIGRLGPPQWEQLLGFLRALEMEMEPSTVFPAESPDVLKGMVRVFLTLSGHQTRPIIDQLWDGIYDGKRFRITSHELFDACRCDELADAAKGVPFELVP